MDVVVDTEWEPNKMKRYNVKLRVDGWVVTDLIKEHENGKYVKYEDMVRVKWAGGRYGDHIKLDLATYSQARRDAELADIMDEAVDEYLRLTDFDTAKKLIMQDIKSK